jgi:small subunit ribosomal protein S6e
MKDSVGFNPLRGGQRKRKLIRGRSLSSDISQVNLKVIEYGPKTIEELLNPEVA